MLYLRNDAIGTAAIAQLCAIPGVMGVIMGDARAPAPRGGDACL